MKAIKLQSKAQLPTRWGRAEIRTYANDEGERMPMVALIFGQLESPVAVRLHSECLTGDVLGSLKCDCGDQLHYSLEFLGKNGGVLLYLRQEGRDIGLTNKIRAYALQDLGADTVQANHQLGFGSDLRNYEDAANVLRDLGISSVRLLTNNPDKQKSLENLGIEVQERLPVVIPPNEVNKGYLQTKKDVMGHLLGD